MDLRRIVCTKNAAVKGVIRRAINHCVRERRVVPSEDDAVMNFLSQVYDDQRVVNRRYVAYERLRNFRLKQEEQKYTVERTLENYTLFGKRLPSWNRS